MNAAVAAVAVVIRVRAATGVVVKAVAVISMVGPYKDCAFYATRKNSYTQFMRMRVLTGNTILLATAALYLLHQYAPNPITYALPFMLLVAVALSYDRVRENADQDALTRVLNRRGFETALPHSLPGAVVMIDLDDFKLVNDTYGHTAGDLVLKEVAKVMQHSARPTDLVARIGGDEFILVLPNVSMEDGVRVANRLQENLANIRIQHPKGLIQISASIGVSIASAQSNSVTALLWKTQGAMKASKGKGKNTVSLAPESSVPPPAAEAG